MNLPKILNDFQDKLHANYESYYKSKLDNYKIDFVKNVKDRKD